MKFYAFINGSDSVGLAVSIDYVNGSDSNSSTTLVGLGNTSAWTLHAINITLDKQEKYQVKR